MCCLGRCFTRFALSARDLCPPNSCDCAEKVLPRNRGLDERRRGGEEKVFPLFFPTLAIVVTLVGAGSAAHGMQP